MGGVTLMRKDARVTDETGWARLHRIADARRRRLGLSQQGVHEAGGPSPAWQRKLRYETGDPTVRNMTQMDRLDRALGWSAGVSVDLVRGDRSTWSREMLDTEEADLVEGASDSVVDEIGQFADAVAMRLRALPADRAQYLMERIYDLLRP